MKNALAGMRCSVIAFSIALILPFPGIAQEESSGAQPLSRILIDRRQPEQSMLAQAPSVTKDWSLGETVLQFSKKTGKVDVASIKRLSELVWTHRGVCSPDSTFPFRPTIVLLLDSGVDRLERMERMAAIAAAFKNDGVDCERIRVATVEDAASLDYFKSIWGTSHKRRNRTVQALLTSDSAGNEWYFLIEQRCSFLAYLSDFLPE